MTSFNQDLVRYRLAKARETLAEAKALFESGYTTGVVNRSYYACFYAVNALLLTEGLASAKHSGVMSMFNQHFIKPGRIPADLGAFYNQLLERRQAGDYREMVSFDRDDVQSWLNESERFIEAIAQWLHENCGID